METYYSAYQAYERKMVRGEFFTSHRQKARFILSYPTREPIVARFGDFLIRTGMKLKCRATAGKPMAWSPMTGSRQ